MKKEKEKLHLKTKPILKPSPKKWSRIGVFEDTNKIVYNDPELDIPRGTPYDIYLISPLSGDDIVQGDLFTVVPEYNQPYICMDIRDDKIISNHVVLEENKFIKDKTEYGFYPWDIRKLLASSDQMNYLGLPFINKHELEKIINTLNSGEEIFPEMSFELYTIPTKEFLSVETNNLTGSALIINKTQEEVKTETDAFKLWEDGIAPKLKTSCGNYKIFVQFLNEYIKNKDKLK